MSTINTDFFSGGKLLKIKDTLNLNDTQNKTKQYNNYDFTSFVPL